MVSGLHTERTDEDGWATFPIVENAFGFGNTPVSHVFIDHEEVHGELNPDNGETYSFTKPYPEALVPNQFKDIPALGGSAPR